jgi:hypothetical protein
MSELFGRFANAKPWVKFLLIGVLLFALLSLIIMGGMLILRIGGFGTAVVNGALIGFILAAVITLLLKRNYNKSFHGQNVGGSRPPMYVKPSRTTVKIAKSNERRLPDPSMKTKYLLPDDLNTIMYDEHHSSEFLADVFTGIFVRRYKGEHRWRRAWRNFWIWLIVLGAIAVATSLALTSRLGTVSTSGTLGVLIVTTSCYCIVVAFGTWHAWTRIRLVVSKRILAEIHDCWPWLPTKWSYVFVATLTETSYSQGFWAKVLRYGNHIIQTTEQDAMITEWNKSRQPERLDMVLETVNARHTQFRQ